LLYGIIMGVFRYTLINKTGDDVDPDVLRDASMVKKRIEELLSADD